MQFTLTELSQTLTQHKPMKKILATLLIFSAIGLGVIAFGVRGGSTRPNANADAFNRGPDVDQLECHCATQR